MSSQTSEQLKPRFLNSISEVSASEWDRLAGSDYPFLCHAFLSALESSGCTTAEKGWQVHHLIIPDPKQPERLLACLPLYLKTHSYGEYVFDWAWADAYSQHGLNYYPKLLSAIPFTPCAGPRLCLDPELDPTYTTTLIITAVQTCAAQHSASGWHLLFPDAKQLALLDSQHLLLRTGCQYQWFNQAYQDFEDFLATLTSRKRKNLRKERQRVQDQGISFRVLEGREINDAQWQQFYHFYSNTYLVRGRPPYLNPEFFLALGRDMPDQLMLVLAEKQDTPLAAALFFKGADTLYGRYWGCSEESMFLHFETCYYQGIDYCIRHAYKRFDSGAQGEHKIQRGFKPVPTWSLHWLAHDDFQDAVARFLREEESHINEYLNHAAEFLPFRKDLEL